MIIRQASTADAGRVLEFLQEFRAEGLETVLQHQPLPTIEDEEAFIGKLDGQWGVMFMAEVGGEVVGCLTAECHRHPQLQHSCEFGIGVLKQHRGKGIGAKLIAHLREWAQSMHLRRIELSVFGGNHKAIALYDKLGFRQEGRKIGAVRIGTRYEDSVQMVLDLRCLPNNALQATCEEARA